MKYKDSVNVTCWLHHYYDDCFATLVVDVTSTTLPKMLCLHNTPIHGRTGNKIWLRKKKMNEKVWSPFPWILFFPISSILLIRPSSPIKLCTQIYFFYSVLGVVAEPIWCLSIKYSSSQLAFVPLWVTLEITAFLKLKFVNRRSKNNEWSSLFQFSK